MNSIAIDIGGTKIASAVFTPDGKMHNRTEYPVGNKCGEDVGKIVLDLIDIQFSYSSVNNLRIASIGGCIPGIYWAEKQEVWAPNIPGWNNYPLTEIIKNHIKNDQISVAIDSDRACYILGEVWKGAAVGCKNVIFMAVGTGIGLGIILNGELVRGANDIAGATGWMALERPFQEKYSSCGCYEYSASGAGLARKALELISEEADYSGELRMVEPEELNAKHIFSAFSRGDIIASKVISNAIELWGMAIANYISLFNPEKIIIGGGVFSSASGLIPDIIKEAEKWAQPISLKLTKIVPAILGSDAGLFGAACLSKNHDIAMPSTAASVENTE